MQDLVFNETEDIKREIHVNCRSLANMKAEIEKLSKDPKVQQYLDLTKNFAGLTEYTHELMEKQRKLNVENNLMGTTSRR